MDNRPANNKQPYKRSYNGFVINKDVYYTTMVVHEEISKPMILSIIQNQ